MFKNEDHKNYIKKLFLKEPYYTVAGLMYGFSECCIEGFVENFNKDTKKHFSDGPYMGTGLIPCLCCAKSIKENNNWSEYQDKINKNRKIKTKFPEGHDFNELYRYFYKISILLELNPLEISSLMEDKNLTKVVKQEIKLSNKKHKENNLILNFIKNKNELSSQILLQYIINNDSLVKFTMADTINKMTYYFADPDFPYIDKKELTYNNIRNRNTIDYIFSAHLIDKLNVVLRNIPPEYNIDKLIPEMHKNIYEYCLEESQKNVKLLQIEEKEKIRYKR